MEDNIEGRYVAFSKPRLNWKKWECFDLDTRDLLGMVEYNSDTKRYIFIPQKNHILLSEHMSEILGFMQKVEEE